MQPGARLFNFNDENVVLLVRSPAAGAVRPIATDQYLLPAGPAAANLQQRVCCCETLTKHYLFICKTT